jgi:TRAP-type C4-dicarboxylate transport system permease large subunit
VLVTNILLLLVLALITYWPAMTMWLPDLVFGPAG